MAHTLRIARYALLGTLFALVVAAAGTLVSIGLDATRTPTWFAGGIEHFRCGVSQWGWVPLPHCELKAATRPDKIGPAMMMVAAILGVVLALCLLVGFERKHIETMHALATTRALAATRQEALADLSPPSGKAIPNLSAGRERQTLALADGREGVPGAEKNRES